MAIADFPADRSVQSIIARGAQALVRWVVARRAARQKRQALYNLLFAPEHLLRDVGVSREEVIERIGRKAASRQEWHRY